MPGYPALTYEKFAALTGEEQRAVLQHELYHMLRYYHATPAELTAILGDMCFYEACAPKTRELVRVFPAAVDVRAAPLHPADVSGFAVNRMANRNPEP